MMRYEPCPTCSGTIAINDEGFKVHLADIFKGHVEANNNTMNKLLAWFDGKKTILCGLGIFITSGAFALGWIDAATRDALLGLFGAGGLVSMRMAIAKK